VTHLRTMLLEELERHNYSTGLIRYYVRYVERFALHFVHDYPDNGVHDRREEHRAPREKGGQLSCLCPVISLKAVQRRLIDDVLALFGGRGQPVIAQPGIGTEIGLIAADSRIPQLEQEMTRARLLTSDWA
jgi:hypothetical protein